MRALAVVALVACTSPEPRALPHPRPPRIEAVRPAPLVLRGPYVVVDPSERVVPLLRADAPSYRYGILDRDACEAELTRRGIAFEVSKATGVDEPVRVKALHGVTLHSIVGARYQVFDCRLALALDDFAAIVAVKDVTDITYAYAYRPQAEYGCTDRYRGLQHCGALAVDIHELAHRDGTRLSIARDFHGKRGLGTCAPGVGPTIKSAKADELWGFVCSAAESALFNVVLTPNWNREHENHFHLEITPEAGWMMVH